MLFVILSTEVVPTANGTVTGQTSTIPIGILLVNLYLIYAEDLTGMGLPKGI
jgi:hypothetical protein